MPVPNVVNTIQTEAENQLRAKGLIPEVVVDNHDSYAAGLVFKQEPAADTELQPGSTVKIYVSSGYKDAEADSAPAPEYHGGDGPADIGWTAGWMRRCPGKSPGLFPRIPGRLC